MSYVIYLFCNELPNLVLIMLTNIGFEYNILGLNIRNLGINSGHIWIIWKKIHQNIVDIKEFVQKFATNSRMHQ